MGGSELEEGGSGMRRVKGEDFVWALKLGAIVLWSSFSMPGVVCEA